MYLIDGERMLNIFVNTELRKSAAKQRKLM